jgi:hypothetical protein
LLEVIGVGVVVTLIIIGVRRVYYKEIRKTHDAEVRANMKRVFGS